MRTVTEWMRFLENCDSDAILELYGPNRERIEVFEAWESGGVPYITTIECNDVLPDDLLD